MPPAVKEQSLSGPSGKSPWEFILSKISKTMALRCIFAMSRDTFGHNLGKGLETQNAVNYPATHRTAP